MACLKDISVNIVFSYRLFVCLRTNEVPYAIKLCMFKVKRFRSFQTLFEPTVIYQMSAFFGTRGDFNGSKHELYTIVK